jgi:hypothetical protein
VDKKKLIRSIPPEDIRGFEEFLDGQPNDDSFISRGGIKKDNSFENLTFISNDASRLTKIKNLLTRKLPFTEKYHQGEALVQEQRESLRTIKKELFQLCDRPHSPYRKSLSEIFNSFFGPTQN